MANSALLIGIDLGGTNVTAGIVDRSGRVLGREKLKTKAEEGPNVVLDRVVKAVRKAMADAGVKATDVRGVGIGAPGSIDFKKGVVVNATNLRWNDVPLADMLSSRLDMPVMLDNDVNVGAWGEYAAGAGKGYDNMLAVFVGTGIGGGLILDGSLYHGHFGSAGEIGHTTVHPDGVLGRRSLENIASRTAVANQIVDLIRANHTSRIHELSGGDLTGIRSKVLAQAVREKDPLAVEVIRHSAHYVAIAAANVVTVLSLPCLVLGGGLPESLGETYVDWVRESFEKHVFHGERNTCKVVAAALGDDAGVVGAALLAGSVFDKRGDGKK